MRTTEKLAPWGCGQQGRYATRKNALYGDECAVRYTWGDFSMTAFILGIVGFGLSLGPWL